MRLLFGSFLSGFLFSIGLSISGMTQPKKVLAFLDVFGNWDPSLLWVMIGAITVYSVTYRIGLANKTPLFSPAFHIPEVKSVDKFLVFGAIIFGIGWGLAGFCPGPALTSLMTLKQDPFLFCLGLILGMFIFKQLRQWKAL